jgi:predicted hotdog family 3-hydroxylacyl-ACP dehydratase
VSTATLPRAAREFLPHEGDAVLLDEVWAVSATRTRATATVRPGIPFCATQADATATGHAAVGDAVGWPAWLAIELLAQVVAASAGLREYRPGAHSRLGLLLGAREFRSRLQWLPAGAQLELTVDESSREANGMGVYDGVLCIDGETIASTILSAYLPEDVDDYLQRVEP